MAQLEQLATQPLDGSQQQESSQDSKLDNAAWGLLLPASNSFPKTELKLDSYLFGRDNSCTVPITPDMLNDNKKWQSISNKHFFIVRDTEQNCAILKDVSSNGTFINGERIKCKPGQPKQIVIQNNNMISMANKVLKAFVFVDLQKSQHDLDIYPQSVKEAYQICQQLGHGASGEVRLAFQVGTCLRVALKVINKRSTESKGMNTQSTPFVTKVIDVIDLPDQTYIAMDYLEGGTLSGKISRAKKNPSELSEDNVKFLFYQVLLAVQYLHSKNIVHRDLKPENILLQSDDPQTLVKVSDFGLSKFINHEVPITLCGSRGYLAPEVLTGRGRAAYTPHLVGFRPFDSEVDDVKAMARLQSQSQFLMETDREVSSDARGLVKAMLIVDPQKRSTIRQLLASRWFDDKLKDKVNSLLMAKPAKRAPPIGLISEDGTAVPLQADCEETVPKKPRLDITPCSSGDGEDNQCALKETGVPLLNEDNFHKLPFPTHQNL
ncbi:hypothetical protein B566_EDAN000879 [Ephemera danica]|nr:hypothetical protein B566_EDAN000879 [Ephemera danica]